MNVCIDTNAYSQLLRGNAALAAVLGISDEIVVPAAVVAESVEGFLLGTRFQDNMARLDAFLARPNVRLQPADMRIAVRFGILKAGLHRKGRPIPVNDIWIAATAFETGTQIVSYDRHFDEIDGLVRIAP